MVEIKIYYTIHHYWAHYNEHISIDMIAAIEKNSLMALTSAIEVKKLYKIYLKDGAKMYTDLAGYRKILKFSREQGCDTNKYVK